MLAIRRLMGPAASHRCDLRESITEIIARLAKSIVRARGRRSAVTGTARCNGPGIDGRRARLWVAN